MNLNLKVILLFCNFNSNYNNVTCVPIDYFFNQKYHNLFNLPYLDIAIATHGINNPKMPPKTHPFITQSMRHLQRAMANKRF